MPGNTQGEEVADPPRTGRSPTALASRGAGLARSAVPGGRFEIRRFVSELATDLGRFPALARWRSEDLQRMAGLIGSLMVTAVLDVLDPNTASPGDEQELVRTLESQLRLIVLGASPWRSPEP